MDTTTTFTMAREKQFGGSIMNVPAIALTLPYNGPVASLVGWFDCDEVAKSLVGYIFGKILTNGVFV
jgi:hypothetical protein